MPEFVSSKSLTMQESLDSETHKRNQCCHLCGIPIGCSPHKQVVNGKALHFCCPGCEYVFQVLFNAPRGMPADFWKTELYRTCVESKIIPRSEEDLAPWQDRMEYKDRPHLLSQSQGGSEHAMGLILKVEGMWCPACSWLIEQVLGRIKGVLEARVSFLSDTAEVKYLPQALSPQDIVEKIMALGYRPSLFQQDSEGSAERKDLLLRLGVSSFLTANLMMISFALYFGFFQELSQRAIAFLSYPVWLLATPVVFYGGFPILRRAFMGLRYMKPSMDTLISMGALSAYGYSIIQMIKGSLHLYFDTASMLVTLVLLGKYIEIQAREKVSRGFMELYRMANRKVRIWNEGKERWVSPDAVNPGDQILVLAEESIPLDGKIISGRARVDESIITGESKPVKKGPDDEVMGGSLLLEKELRLNVTRVGLESSIGKMIRLMQDALNRKNPMELLADRIMRCLVPVVVILAAGTAMYLLSHGFTMDKALLRAVTVLVITCPCALGIATPLAKVAAMGLGRNKGLLIRDPEALEGAKDLDVLIFDKTGTLTEGRFSLKEVVTWGVTKEEALSLVAAVEAHSDHFLAREILHQAREMQQKFEKAQSFEAYEGMGVKGEVDGLEVVAGNRRLLCIQRITIPSPLDQKARSMESKGATIVFFGWRRQARGFLAFGDSIKEGAREAIQELKSRGIVPWLISGDAQETTRGVAKQLDISHFQGAALPKDKVELMKNLQKKGHRVGMVGDGINDAAALAQADVGFALGNRTDISQEASDLTIMAGDPTLVLKAVDLSALTMKTIRQNLSFAFLYNAFGIPFAVAGLLNPLLAVFAMFASSLTVIGNTLRLSGRQG